MTRLWRQNQACSHYNQLVKDLIDYAGSYYSSKDQGALKTATVNALHRHLPYVNIDHCLVLANDFSRDNGRFVYVRHERLKADQAVSRLQMGVMRIFWGRNADTVGRAGHGTTQTYADCMKLLQKRAMDKFAEKHVVSPGFYGTGMRGWEEVTPTQTLDRILPLMAHFRSEVSDDFCTEYCDVTGSYPVGVDSSLSDRQVRLA